MPTIPEVRETLANIANEMRKSHDMNMVFLAGDVEQAVKDLFRRSASRKAPRKLAPLNDYEVRRVRAMAKDFPDMSQLEIANTLGTNPGRVSEALRGKRR